MAKEVFENQEVIQAEQTAVPNEIEQQAQAYGEKLKVSLFSTIPTRTHSLHTDIDLDASTFLTRLSQSSSGDDKPTNITLVIPMQGEYNTQELKIGIGKQEIHPFSEVTDKAEFETAISFFRNMNNAREPISFDRYVPISIKVQGEIKLLADTTEEERQRALSHIEQRINHLPNEHPLLLHLQEIYTFIQGESAPDKHARQVAQSYDGLKGRRDYGLHFKPGEIITSNHPFTQTSAWFSSLQRVQKIYKETGELPYASTDVENSIDYIIPKYLLSAVIDWNKTTSEGICIPFPNGLYPTHIFESKVPIAEDSSFEYFEQWEEGQDFMVKPSEGKKFIDFRFNLLPPTNIIVLDKGSKRELVFRPAIEVQGIQDDGSIVKIYRINRRYDVANNALCVLVQENDGQIQLYPFAYKQSQGKGGLVTNSHQKIDYDPNQLTERKQYKQYIPETYTKLWLLSLLLPEETQQM